MDPRDDSAATGRPAPRVCSDSRQGEHRTKPPPDAGESAVGRPVSCLDGGFLSLQGIAPDGGDPAPRLTRRAILDGRAPAQRVRE